MKKKVKQKEIKKQKESPKVKGDDSTIEPEKPFDFGGIPDRNLKKNLGCG